MNRYKINEASSSKHSGMSEYETFKLNNYIDKVRKDNCSSDEETDDAEIIDSNQVLFHTLLTDAVKRAKVLELLTQQGLVPNDNKSKRGRKKNNIENIEQNKALTLFTQFLKSPVSKFIGKNKVKNSPVNNVRRKFNIESPSALQRRRALQKMESNNSSTESEKSCSQSSETFQGTPVPFEELLKGVVAFVEVRSAEGDRSELIKSMMKAMGATVRDTFSRDITHVIFRDGSFRTFEKAKLVKAKLVSVLWLDATRRNRFRVPESKYPALGVQAYDYNVSSLCQSMQKDYNDIVRDEKRRRSEIRLSHRTTDHIKKRQTMHISNIHKENSAHSNIRSINSRSNSINTLQKDIFYLDSDSDSISIHSDIIPSSQTEQTTSFVKRTENKHTNNYNNSFELTEDESVPNIIIKDSLELKSCLKIRSPESVTKNNQIVLHDSNENNKNEEESFHLRVTSDDSNVINSKSSTSCTKSLDEINIVNNSDTKSIEISKLNNEDNNVIITNTPTSNNYSKRLTDNSGTKLNGDIIIDETPKSRNNSKILYSKINQRQSETSFKSKTNNFDCNDKSDDFLSFKPKTKQNINNVVNDKILINDKIKEKNELQICKTIVDNELNINLDLENMKSTNNDKNNEMSINKEITCKKAINHETNEKKNENTNNLKSNFNDEIIIGETSSTNVNKKIRNTRRSMIECPILNSNPDGDTVKLVRRKKRITCITELTRGLDTSNEEKKTEERVFNILKENTKNNVEDIENNGVTTRKKFRRLFDINQSIDETIWGNQQEETELEENGNDVIPKKKKKYNVILPPGLKTPKILTRRATEYVKKKHAKKNITSSSEDISPNTKLKTNNMTIKKKVEVSTPIKVQENKKNYSEIQNEHLLIRDKMINSPMQCIKNNKNDNAKKHVNDTIYTSDESDSKNPDIKNRKKQKRKTISKTPIKSQNKINKLKTNKEKKNNEITTQQTVASNTQKKISDKLDSKQLFNKLQMKLLGDIAERRSSLEFDKKTKSNELIPTQKSIKKIKLPGITCTRLHKADVQIFEQIVKKLGGFIIDNEVNERTTHLVAGQCSRTINLLRALARGCWILRQEWMYKSLETGKWLDEEEYELTEFSPALQKCRVERQTFGPEYTIDVFKDCGPIYISRGSTPSCSDLEELVTLCNGTIVNTPRQAKIIVGQLFRYEHIVCVNEKWILDCITYNKLKSFKNFILEKSV